MYRLINRIMITGIAGFLGSHLSDFFLMKGYEVIGIDDLSTGNMDNVSPLVEFHKWDINSQSLKNLMSGCDVVVHCAAAAYEGVSVFSPSFISKNIYAGSANVFSAAIHSGVKRIVNTSSMARFGNGHPAPFRETGTCNPVDPYGLAKYSADKLLTMLAEIHGIQYSIAVPHNIYGPRQLYTDPGRNVAAIMTNRMLQGKQPIIYGDGTQVRCFSYVHDVVPFLAKMCLDDAYNGQTINLGPDRGEVTINELAEILADIIGFKLDPIYMPGRPQEVKHATCSSDLARKILGLEESTRLRDGLTQMVNYIQKKGPKPFSYGHINLEIINDKTPKTWTDKLI